MAGVFGLELFNLDIKIRPVGSGGSLSVQANRRGKLLVSSTHRRAAAQHGVRYPMKIVFAFIVSLLSGYVIAADPYSVENIMLLQPDFVLAERVDVNDLSNYIKSVNAAAAASLATTAKPSPAAGFIVIAVRPGGQSKVWLDFSPTPPPAMAIQLRSSLEQVAPFSAKGGVVVFAISATLWGAAATERPGPAPTEWQEATKDKSEPMDVEELIEQVWPSKAGS